MLLSLRKKGASCTEMATDHDPFGDENISGTPLKLFVGQVSFRRLCAMPRSFLRLVFAPQSMCEGCVICRAAPWELLCFEEKERRQKK